MGKSKQNAYQMFVKEEARRREQSGQPVNYGNLFSELGEKWRDLPDEKKNWYKQKAEQWNNKPPPPTLSGDLFLKPSSAPSSFEPKPSTSKQFEPRPSTSWDDGSGYSTGFKHMSAYKGAFGMSLLPRPSAVRDHGQYSLKRPLDQFMDTEPEKKVRLLGHGIPNWSNVKNESQAQRRYKGLPTFEMMKKCSNFIRDRERRVLKTPIFTISVNVLCKIKSKTPEASFIPIELSIYSYVIGAGRYAPPYSVIIDAGPPPTNHINLAIDHAQYHKITFPPREEYPDCSRNDYGNIYSEIIDYVKHGDRSIIVPSMREMPQVEKSLEWLYKKACESSTGHKPPNISTFSIFPLKEYVLGMYNWATQNMLKIPPEASFAYQYWLSYCIEMGGYEYDSVFMCPYHRDEEFQTKYCSLSRATRMINDIEKLLDEIADMYRHVYKRLDLTKPARMVITSFGHPEGEQERIEEAERLQAERLQKMVKYREEAQADRPEEPAESSSESKTK